MQDEIEDKQVLPVESPLGSVEHTEVGEQAEFNAITSLPSTFWDNLSIFLSLLGVKEETVSNATSVILKVWPIFSEQLPGLLDHFEGDLSDVGSAIKFFCTERVLNTVSTAIQTATGIDMSDALGSCASIISATVPLFTTFVSNGSIGKSLASLKGVLNVH